MVKTLTLPFWGRQGRGSIPGRETKIPHAAQHSQKKRDRLVITYRMTGGDRGTDEDKAGKW